jgi:hypothetical protein
MMGISIQENLFVKNAILLVKLATFSPKNALIVRLVYIALIHQTVALALVMKSTLMTVHLYANVAI